MLRSTATLRGSISSRARRSVMVRGSGTENGSPFNVIVTEAEGTIALDALSIEALRDCRAERGCCDGRRGPWLDGVRAVVVDGGPTHGPPPRHHPHHD